MSSVSASDRIATSLGLVDGSYKQKIERDRTLNVWKEKMRNDPPTSFLDLPTSFHEKLETEQAHVDLDEAEDVLRSAFCHHYLPQLALAHSIAAPNKWHNPWTTSLKAITCRNHVFDRFSRLPEEGAALLDSFYGLYALNMPTMEFILDPINAPRAPLLETSAWHAILFHLCISQADGVAPKAVTSPSALAFLRRLDLFQHDLMANKARLPPELQKPATNIEVANRAFLALLEGRVPPRSFNPESFPFMRMSAWWRCEGKDAEPGMSCRTMESGEEMMQCGRCQSVRYCSVAHQKAHWKTHKKTCWEPIW